MAIPIPAEVAIYEQAVRSIESRVAVGLDFPAWTADVTDLFGGSAIDPDLWWHTQPAPAVSGGSLRIRGSGAPPFEVAISRTLWFPTIDLALGFEVEINATFPTAPGYTTMIALGGLEGGRSKVADPTRIVLVGEDANIFGASTGEIQIQGGFGAGSFLTHTFANDMLAHEYIFRFNPLAPVPFEAADARNTILLDNVIVVEHTDALESDEVIQVPNTIRPFFIQIGIISEFSPNVASASGSPTAPADIIQVHDVTVRSLAPFGHETRVYPGWTTPNAGGNLDTAALGERFSLDGETWAKPPNVREWNVLRGRDRDADSFSVVLEGGDPDDPDTASNIFAGTRWRRRPIIIDTRVLNEAGTATGWKRQIAGIVENVTPDVSEDGVVLTIEGRDRPSVKLDTTLSRTYLNAALGGNEPLVNVGFDMTAILEDIIELSDAHWAADPLGPTDRDINASQDMTPELLSAGGGNLLAAFTQITDEIALEVVRLYTVTGTGRYGLVRTGLWNFGIDPRRLAAEAKQWAFVRRSGLTNEGTWETGAGSAFDTSLLKLGEDTGVLFHIFVLFDFAQLPRRGTITSAEIVFISEGAGGGVVFDGDVFFGTLIPAVAPTTQAGAEALALTTAAPWDFTNNAADADYVRTPDLSSILQEVIDDDGWSPGLPQLGVVRTTTATGTFEFRDGALNVKLIVTYEDGNEYVLRGVGSLLGSNTIGRLTLPETLRDGVGQVPVHADQMSQSRAVFSGGEPGPGDYPRAPYPPEAMELHMSLAESGLVFTLPLFRTPDIRGHIRRGSVGQFRWLRENANRRRTRLTLFGQDWIEPSDQVGIDDPEDTGLDGLTEGWVVDGLSLRFSDDSLEAQVDLVSQDILRAVLGSL